jgi:hypothetical protein
MLDNDWYIYALIGFAAINLGLFLYISYLHGRIQKQTEMTGHIIQAINRLENEVRQK